jgi:hypothetical protein
MTYARIRCDRDRHIPYGNYVLACYYLMRASKRSLLVSKPTYQHTGDRAVSARRPNAYELQDSYLKKGNATKNILSALIWVIKSQCRCSRSELGMPCALTAEPLCN